MKRVKKMLLMFWTNILVSAIIILIVAGILAWVA